MRLVDIDIVLKFIEDIKCDKNTPKNYGTLLDIMRFIRSQPTVYDVVEVVKPLADKIEPNEDFETGEPCNNWVVDMHEKIDEMMFPDKPNDYTRAHNKALYDVKQLILAEQKETCVKTVFDNITKSPKAFAEWLEEALLDSGIWSNMTTCGVIKYLNQPYIE